MTLIPVLNKSKLNNNEIEQVQQQQKELKFINKIKKVPGHTLFSFNFKTKEIKVAEVIKKVSIGLNKEPVYKDELVIESDCYYEQALNKANFIKKLKKYNYL